MQLKITILFLFISLSALSQNDSGFAYYSKKMDLALNTIKENDLKNTLLQIDDNILKLKYVLTFNSKNGLYKEIKQLDTNENNLGLNMARIASGCDGEYYYDIKNDLLINAKNYSGKNFLVYSKLKDENWIMTNEMKVISGYSCYKAYFNDVVELNNANSKITVEAWYAPEIPINYGPDGYGGLPGLIVLLKKNKVITYLNKINFTKTNTIEIPTKGEKIDKQAFSNLAKEMNLKR